MRDLKYSEILRNNTRLFGTLKSDPVNISVLSNITIHQIKELLEYSLRIESINADVVIGDYNNIVQDSKKYQDSHLVIVFLELCNTVDNLQYKVEVFNADSLKTITDKIETEIDLALINLQETSLVLINKISSLHFTNTTIDENNLDLLAKNLNRYLENKITENIRIVDLDKIIASVGVEKSISLRNYYSSKALYTVDFLKRYVEYVRPLIVSAHGKSKKAIIFDCDNTLWRGILGEDGFNGIEMSPETRDGAIFSEIQSILLTLYRRGVLIGLCSKNNPEDVAEVVMTHPDMQLRDEHIAINKCNWSDKATNLIEIAQELNIGLDSIVFVEDSDFEVNLINAKLPDITVLQVPTRLYEYPLMLRENTGLFYNGTVTMEDEQRTGMYKQQAQRETVKATFIDIDDYLATLEIEITMHMDEKSIIPRLSQLSQKTNQFNLTTRRYTDRDIIKFMESDAYNVIGLTVRDKYGDSGVTGLCIVKHHDEIRSAEIDTLLMSCRIIGRNIEYAFVDYIVGLMVEKHVDVIKAKYIYTPKNKQVSEFYEKCSFTLIKSVDSFRNYILDIGDYTPTQLSYIDINS